MGKELVKKEATMANRFVAAIMDEFVGTVGNLPAGFDAKKKRLAQHLFLQIDAVLPALELKREGNSYQKNNPAIAWSSLNMAKLAVDAMRRVELGLDALIPNHISVIPYLNKRTKKYDVDLRIGYVGADYYRRAMAVEKPVDIIYELVYETDKFEVLKKSIANPVDAYVFEITEPFNRGKVVGGFGYIQFGNKALNKLVIVSEDDFLKSKKAGKTDTFWGPYGDEMRYKTLVHRVTAKLQVDPDKINTAYAAVEAEEIVNITLPANNLLQAGENVAFEPIDIEPEPPETKKESSADELTEEEKAEILKQELAEVEGAPGF